MFMGTQQITTVGSDQATLAVETKEQQSWPVQEPRLAAERPMNTKR